MARPEKALDARVLQAGPGKPTKYEQRGTVVKHTVKDDLPDDYEVRLKGVPAHPKRFKKAGKHLTWDPPISIYTPVSGWSGGTKLWEWTAFNGDVA